MRRLPRTRFVVLLISWGTSLIFCSTVFCASPSVHADAWKRAEQLCPVRNEYRINVSIDPSNNSYRGHERVIFSNQQKRSTNYLLFFLYPNDPALTKVEEKHLMVRNVRVDRFETRVEESGPFLRVYLDGELKAGEKVTIDMDLEGVVPVQKEQQPDLFSQAIQDLARVLNPETQTETDYGIFSTTGDVMNLGLWYPVLSKFDADGWDEERYSGLGDVSYFDVADFHVTVTVPASYRLVTTGIPVLESREGDAVKKLEIEALLSRDFEMELSSKFQSVEEVVDGTRVRSHFRQENDESGRKVLNSAVRAVRYFEQAFGKYPYTELDLVEAPLYSGAGGVEFPGLVTIASYLYVPSSGEDSDPFQSIVAGSESWDELLEFVVVHEVAHQWWNAVVGSNSKLHPYVDEAMANYSAIMYFQHYYGRQSAEKQMSLQMKANYQLHRMLGGEDRPVMLPASSFEGALEYAAIVYGKGALYYDHLRSLIGDPVFLRSMRAYYDRYWFAVAGPEGMTSIAEQNSKGKAKEIEALYQRWMHGTHGDEDIGPGTLDGVLRTVLSTNPELSQENLEEMLNQLNQILNQQ